MSGLEEARKLVEKYFEGKFDKGNHPYFEHLEYVSSKGRNEEEKIIGLLHDILEDTPLTEEDLKKLGFSDFIVKTITILTRPKNVSYEKYIDSIIKSKNQTALFIKIKDMEHNLDFTRIKNLPIEEKKRLEKKYRPNYNKLILKWENER